MTTTTTTYTGEVACVPRAGTLYDCLELILDRGMVIDVFIRVSLVGIEILKIDIRICVASVDTYLRFAEACNRLDLETDTRSKTVPELFGGGGMATGIGKAGAKKAARSVGGRVKEAIGAGGGDSEEDRDEEEGPSRTTTRRRSGTRTAGSRTRTSRRTRED
ncbi:gas vesicle protein GvpJ [Streptomyces meridianus]|uniref:Gas vesicle protein A n=1 Tax=Streptomyces meridianus TaxID=2938945 RepID=A0ABT0XBR7_9ACTN|nr:gas vesicle protein GvpJ [Streptomyces meridianus]MCM2579968.1 gas vesicle structural protein GvpA [Streptomyces meridianus]